HTIFSRDWSSDVCSSDLATLLLLRLPGLARLAEDGADALHRLAVFIHRGHGLARLARHRLQQRRVDLLDRDLLADVGLDVRQAHRISLAGDTVGVAFGDQACWSTAVL